MLRICRASPIAAEKYFAPFLQPGRYEVTASKAGFAKVVRKDLTLDVGQTLTIDFAMPLHLGCLLSGSCSA